VPGLSVEWSDPITSTAGSHAAATAAARTEAIEVAQDACVKMSPSRHGESSSIHFAAPRRRDGVRKMAFNPATVSHQRPLPERSSTTASGREGSRCKGAAACERRPDNLARLQQRAEFGGIPRRAAERLGCRVTPRHVLMRTGAQRRWRLALVDECHRQEAESLS